MIDSIRLKIYPFNTPENNPFFSEKKGSVDNDENGKPRVRKYVLTNHKWRKQMQQQGKYMPLYWIETSSFKKGMRHFFLEFSVPKFLQGHSYTEVTETVLAKLVSSIMDFCQTVQVSVSKEDILNAAVTMVAYCKNVSVAQYGTAQEIMKMLSGFDYRFRSNFEPKYNSKRELTHIEYFNPTSHFVVYDKLLEIIEHAQTKEEKALVQLIHNQSGQSLKIQDIIRFELCLHNVTAVKQAMGKFSGDKPFYTLEDVFKNSISQALLQSVIGQVYNHPMKAVAANNKQDFYQLNKKIQIYLDQKYTDIKLRSFVQNLVSILHSGGWSAVRSHIKKNCKPRTAAYRIAELKEIEKMGINLGTPNEKILEYILSQFGISEVKNFVATQQSLF